MIIINGKNVQFVGVYAAVDFFFSFLIWIWKNLVWTTFSMTPRMQELLSCHPMR